MIQCPLLPKKWCFVLQTVLYFFRLGVFFNVHFIEMRTKRNTLQWNPIYFSLGRFSRNASKWIVIGVWIDFFMEYRNLREMWDDWNNSLAFVRMVRCANSTVVISVCTNKFAEGFSPFLCYFSVCSLTAFQVMLILR